MSRKLIALVAVAVLLIGSVVFFKSSAVGTTALWNISAEGAWLLPLVSAAALLDSINPCAFAVMLLLLSSILSRRQSRRKTLLA